MPPKRRAQAFSGKKKKEQLQQKRKASKSSIPSHAEFLLSSSAPVVLEKPESRKKEAEKVSKSEKYKLLFQNETREELDLAKRRAQNETIRLGQTARDLSVADIYSEVINYPKRPDWKGETDAKKIDEIERKEFDDFVEKIHEEYQGRNLSYFEHNIETWRQLWRITELCDVICIVADFSSQIGPLELGEAIQEMFPDYPLDQWIEQLKTIAKGEQPRESRFEDNEKEVIKVGFVGHTNVGKSSIMNSLVGEKHFSMSIRPGHTKELQTWNVSEHVQLVDSPGIIFPSTVSRQLQVLSGLFPVDQVREPYSVIGYLAERVNLVSAFHLKHISDELYWTAWDICEAFAKKKNFMVAKRAYPDAYRGANFILRMAVSGQLVLAFEPPGFEAAEFENDPEVKKIKALANKEQFYRRENELEKNHRWKHMKKKQLDSLKRHFPNLEVTSQRFNSNTDRSGAEYTVLKGTIPAPYKGKTYNYSIQILLPLTFPQDPPLAKVVPTDGMRVIPSEYVARTGHISTPYLQNWNIKCSLIELCQTLSTLFSHCPPLVMKESSSSRKKSLPKLDYIPESAAQTQEAFLAYVRDNIDLVKFELECGICKLFFNREERKRTVLSTCGHQLCQECSKKLPRKLCPYCSQEFRDENLVVTF
ncbi:Oidioi.mRNA.OKI2018_I69.chr1.g779.t1.cds [Oikopleura dioica]|uniref:Guanine nucleotide-binding protein-like 1 n=1 Tax=Oikopleura dioica TaxID=34765 RepID=A0ABN7SLF5_OIKDI|nr:Oidioi.mRNA.OKI2018_I69.chr1.g779.t1.cds [Oikopleura dioica]